MAIFAIGDLHLSLGSDKPMDVFQGWENHVQRLETAWKRLVKPEDTVVVVGDVSWALRLENAVEDFSFLNALPGNKIVIKGNHDYWWSTLKKLNEWTEQHDFSTIRFLFNNSYVVEGIGICGSRGWMCGEEDDHVFTRELGRLSRSIASLDGKEYREAIAFLHYPPLYGDLRADAFLECLSQNGIHRCFYGHLHGPSIPYAFNGEEQGIKFRLVSADNLAFAPFKIPETVIQ